MQSASSVSLQAAVRPNLFLRAASSFGGRAINYKPCQTNITSFCNFPNALLIHKRTTWSFNRDSSYPIWKMYTGSRFDNSLYDVSFESFAAYVDEVAKNQIKGSQYFDLRSSNAKASYSDGKVYKLIFSGQDSLNDFDVPKLLKSFPYLTHLEIESCDLSLESVAKLLTKGMRSLEINKCQKIAREKFKKASIV